MNVQEKKYHKIGPELTRSYLNGESIYGVNIEEKRFGNFYLGDDLTNKYLNGDLIINGMNFNQESELKNLINKQNLEINKNKEKRILLHKSRNMKPKKSPSISYSKLAWIEGGTFEENCKSIKEAIDEIKTENYKLDYLINGGVFPLPGTILIIQ